MNSNNLLVTLVIVSILCLGHPILAILAGLLFWDF